MAPGEPGRVTSQLELRWIYTAWLAVPVVGVGFALLGGAVDRLTATPAFARWQLPVEPAAAGHPDTPVLVGGGGASPR